MAVCLGPRGDSELKKQGKEQEERSAGSISRLSSRLKQINLPAKKTSLASYVNCPFYFRSCDALEGIFLFMLLKDYSFVSTKMYLNLKEIILKGLKRGNKQTTLTIERVACYVTVYRGQPAKYLYFLPCK